jgi:hypothetical protein
VDQLDRLEQGLRRVLWTLRPYLSDVVIIGGWVPHLYRRYGGIGHWRSAISFTQEVDILLMRDLPLKEGTSLADLLKRSGFHPVGQETGGAVWESDSSTGERIEFIVPHRGTAKNRNEIARIGSQDEVAGIALTDTTLLQDHTTTLDVPVTVENAPGVKLAVRVPLLGAYAATKAATFLKRQPVLESGLSVSNPKSAKDLLYIRDLMAAGDEVVRQIEADLDRISATSATDRADLRSASNQLGVALRPTPKESVLTAAAMLAERDNVSQGSAEADTVGYLTDFLEILSSAT